jgi:hypothetical protein
MARRKDEDTKSDLQLGYSGGRNFGSGDLCRGPHGGNTARNGTKTLRRAKIMTVGEGRDGSWNSRTERLAEGWDEQYR